MIRTMLPAASRSTSELERHGIGALAAGLARSMDELSIGLAALGPSGAIRWANSAFRSMLRGSRCLGIEREKLRMVNDELSSALSRFLPGCDGSPRIIRIAPDERGLFLLKLHVDRSTFGWTAYVALSETGLTPNRQLLRGMFGLTPAECRIAQEIAAGVSPDEVAIAHSVSRHTVRTQIKSLMSKIGVANRTSLLCALAPFGILARSDDWRAPDPEL
jgi:DNA-binding CsgD family transcriptional regulator